MVRVHKIDTPFRFLEAGDSLALLLNIIFPIIIIYILSFRLLSDTRSWLPLRVKCIVLKLLAKWQLLFRPLSEASRVLVLELGRTNFYIILSAISVS